jgi:hypothetical protein
VAERGVDRGGGKEEGVRGHTNYNTGEVCDCDRPLDDVAHVLDAENFHLWDDLFSAMKRAIRGRWSMECDWIVERIVMLEGVGALRPDRDSLPSVEDGEWLLVMKAVRRERGVRLMSKRVEYRKAVLAKMGGERVWWCEFPEFNDPNCMTGMENPRPQEARIPRKHSTCRWVWIVEEASNE